MFIWQTSQNMFLIDWEIQFMKLKLKLVHNYIHKLRKLNYINYINKLLDSFRSNWDVFIATKYIIRMEIHVKINEAVKKEMSFSRNRWCYLTFSESEPGHIQNPGIFKTCSIFKTLSNIYDRAFYENNANSFWHYFQIWQILTLARPVAVRSN